MRLVRGDVKFTRDNKVAVWLHAMISSRVKPVLDVDINACDCHKVTHPVSSSVFVACQVELFLWLVTIVTGKKLQLSYGVVVIIVTCPVGIFFSHFHVVLYEFELLLLSPLSLVELNGPTSVVNIVTGEVELSYFYCCQHCHW